MKKLIILSLGLLCIAAVMFSGCTGTQTNTSTGNQSIPSLTPTPTMTPSPSAIIAITSGNNGSTLEVPQNSQVQLTLPGNPTTGYSWQMSFSPGLFVDDENGTYVPDATSGQVVGSGGKYIWNITAIASGEQRIEGIYKQPWEPTYGNETTFTVILMVGNETGNQTGPNGMPPRYPVFTITDSDKTVTIPLNEELNVRLAENPSTGYSWNLSATAGLELIEDEYIPDQPVGQPPLVGAGGVHSWHFKATGPGEQTIAGVYRRPWEPLTGNETSFNMQVIVQ
jgi:predicted secreted protein